MVDDQSKVCLNPIRNETLFRRLIFKDRIMKTKQKQKEKSREY